jgi:flagellin
MSRINTNVSSLIAQKTLTTSNDALQQALTRLSTGLRINSGKDDPAGLIASENLRRDITSANTAISNSQQADELIATADSGLGQISGLLNDIRGLAVQAANTGVLSDEQIAANQLQVDSSLEAIDRIAKVTTFQGRKILDGTLDFQKTYTAGGSTVQDLAINSANLGTAGSLDVSVNISAAATQASLTANAFGNATPVQATGPLGLTGGNTLTLTATAGGAADGYVGNTTDVVFQAASDIAQATKTNAGGAPITVSAAAGGAADGVAGNTINLTYQADAGIAQAAGTVTLSTSGETFDLAANAGGAADGAAGNNVNVVLQSGASTSASYDANTNTLTIDVAGGTDTTANVVAAINTGAGADFTASNASAGNVVAGDAGTYNPLSGGSDGTTSASFAGGTITVNVALNDTNANVAAAINSLADFTATNTGSGAFNTGNFGTTNNVLAGGSDGTNTAAYNATTNTLTVGVALNASVANVASAIDTDGTFTTSNAAGATFNSADLTTFTDPLAGGVGTGLAADLVVRVGGDKGSEVFNFRQGATIAQVVNAINLVSDGTGVQAVNNAGVLNLKSTSYGSAGFVDAEVLSEGTGGIFGTALSGTHATGTDVVATVNGATASGKGNVVSVHTSTLDLALTVSPGSTTAVDFTIDGGGAVFQLGPNVVTNQQARIGIANVSTGTLGGTDGRLYELRSGNDKDLATNPNGATLVVDEAINKVTSLRGRLGAFQRTTIETNIASLKDTVTNLTQAESNIRDADFAAETAALTRAQVLVQSGTQVLAIANQQPQNVLALLRNA